MLPSKTCFERPAGPLLRIPLGRDQNALRGSIVIPLIGIGIEAHRKYFLDLPCCSVNNRCDSGRFFPRWRLIAGLPNSGPLKCSFLPPGERTRARRAERS